MMTTRFAPSPTGDLHIGGVRTALYSWLAARQQHGEFRLRIEDTDRERSTDSSTQVILDGMQWLGLNHQGEIIYQSRRFDLYNQVIDDMLAKGLAYYCWMTPEELDELREQQKARGEKPRYNGKYRNGGDPVPGVTPVVRFKNPLDGSVSWEDKVRGRITISNTELDDMIIRRSDGSPTYNFCVVVDDHAQHISLVIRGDDHINNTPRQINLYAALGYPIPEFAHVPMILGDDGKRLSKRHGATNVLSYREEGYLPEAVLNYLVRLGWSHGDQEIFSLDELTRLFRIEDVHSAPSTFNTEKLRWLNQHYLKESSPERLLSGVIEQLATQGISANEATVLRAIPHYQERAKTLKEMAENMQWLFVRPDNYAEKAASKAFKADSPALLRDLANRLDTLPSYEEAAVHSAIEQTVADHHVGFGKVGQPARLAVTAGAPSPDLSITLSLLPQAEASARLRFAAEYIENNQG